MNNKFILKKQANEVFAVAKKIGLNTSEFKWTYAGTKCGKGFDVSKLIHEPTGYYFLFDFAQVFSDYNHQAYYSPGEDKPFISVYTQFWPIQLGEARQWLLALKGEIEAPDLWAAVAQEKQIPEAILSADDSNNKFTASEKKALSAQVEEIKQYIFTNFSLAEKQQDSVIKELKDLKNAVERLGKKDWLKHAQSTLINLCIIVIADPGKIQNLLHFAAIAFGKVYGWTTLQALPW